MLGELGSLLTGLALAAAAYSSGAVLWSIYREDDRWWASGRNAIVSSAVLLGLALAALLVAFLDDQFSIEYVAHHSSRGLPLYLKASAVWGGQNGSLLLWAFLQTLFAALVAGRSGPGARPSKEDPGLVPWATVFLSLIAAFFVALTLFLSNPFAPAEVVPIDGHGLNPLLRHPGMVFHPPPMFIGYVGLAVPFALGLAALITRRLDLWPDAARGWLLVAWLFLGLGLFLGMRWAYDVLGWGGYWGWDPVENAGLMPWLTATALVHGLAMQRERRGFHWWNMSLAIVSFVLVLFGTFTTRSGLIQSVHAFARSRLGPYFLGAIGVTLLGSGALLYNRRTLLATTGSAEGLLSREGTFTLTMILLVTVTGSVLVGTLLPTLTEALLGQRFEASPAWFDRVTGPQFLALLLLMGLCPLLGRTAAASRRLRERRGPPVVGAAVITVAAVIAGFRQPFSLIGFAVVGAAVGTALGEIARGIVQPPVGGVGVQETLSVYLARATRLFSQGRRRYGGYLVHLGVTFMALGVIGTRFYPVETQTLLTPGESFDVQGYTLAFQELEREVHDDRLTTYAVISLSRAGRHLGNLGPRVDEYSPSGQTLGTPAIRSGVREDIYLVLAGWADGGQQVTLRVFINPLVSFLWLGGLLFLGGGTVALWPATEAMAGRAPARRRRRLWSTAGVVVACVLVVVAGWAMWQPTQPSVDRAGGSRTGLSALAGNRQARPRVGDPAPDFTLPLLDGSTLSLSELRGQVVVVNFWSPHCKPCEEEIPDLQTVWEEYQSEGVAFVGISFPEFEADVREMVSEFGVTYVNGLDVVAPVQYGVTAVPETFVIGPHGRVASVHIGRVTAERLRSEVDALLAE